MRPASAARNETEKTGNVVTVAGNSFMGTGREYLSEKIHWLDESLASKQAARQRNFRCNFRTGIRAMHGEQKERKKERSAGRKHRTSRRTKRKRRMKKRGKGRKNCSTWDRKRFASAYNRQGVDSRLLDLRQSNFANETYPATQLASTRARACARVHARKLAVISYSVERR